MVFKFGQVGKISTAWWAPAINYYTRVDNRVDIVIKMTLRNMHESTKNWVYRTWQIRT